MPGDRSNGDLDHFGGLAVWPGEVDADDRGLFLAALTHGIFGEMADGDLDNRAHPEMWASWLVLGVGFVVWVLEGTRSRLGLVTVAAAYLATFVAVSVWRRRRHRDC